MKKTILFMPSWYPTKENPISGSFFKEQGKVLAENFNFIVLHYNEQPIGLSGLVKSFFTQKFVSCYFDKSEPLLPELYFFNYFLSPCGVVGKIIKKIHLYNFLKKRRISKNRQILKNIINKEFNVLPDLLYAVTAQVNAIQAAELSCIFNIPYVVAEHAPFPLPQSSISNETKKAIENANCVLSISRDKIRQMLIQGLQIVPEIIGNMVDEDVFTLSLDKRNTFFTILIVASYNFYKDYSTFFKTIKKLKEICCNSFRVLIVGYAPVVEKSLWSLGEVEFRNLVSRYGLLDLCDLVPKVSRSQMTDYYHKADVFVMTSIQEGFPVSCLEASSCGLPVYSTRCGGVEDFIDNENGILVNIQDYETLAKELKKLIDGEVSYDSALIRKKTVEKYGKEAFKNRLTNIFNRVIEEYKIDNKDIAKNKK